MTSWSLWVMMTRALPSAFIFRMTSKSRSVSWGVSTAVGSIQDQDVCAPVEDLDDLTVCFSDTDMS